MRLCPVAEGDIDGIEQMFADPEALGEFLWGGWHDPLSFGEPGFAVVADNLNRFELSQTATNLESTNRRRTTKRLLGCNT
ncbi:MAG TPA: hypothetical protein DGG94_13425 [Micromonosporaceae bacterium]|nr:hypothetical protein [Micromonosporaceae bacterium]